MRNLFLVAIALLLGFNSYSQPTNKVCLSVAQAAKIADSLAVLPLVRQEARLWHQVADSTQHEADSLRRATGLYLDAKRAAENAEVFQRRLTLSKQAELTDYKRKAHRRGFVNYLLLALSLGAGYLQLTH